MVKRNLPWLLIQDKTNICQVLQALCAWHSLWPPPEFLWWYNIRLLLSSLAWLQEVACQESKHKSRFKHLNKQPMLQCLVCVVYASVWTIQQAHQKPGTVHIKSGILQHILQAKVLIFRQMCCRWRAARYQWDKIWKESKNAIMRERGKGGKEKKTK